MDINKLEVGIYTSKELCSITNYSYTSFTNDRGRTFFSKLNEICEIEKIGKGKGTKYKITNIKDIQDFDINKRKSREVEYSTMSDLFKAPIIHLLCSKSNGAYTGTFDNWLVYTSLVQRGFKKINDKFTTNQTLDNNLNDFLNVEGQSLHYNFLQAIEKLRKARIIEWYKTRMVVENVGGKEKHRSIRDDMELSALLEIENKFNKKYNITDRNDLVYGNPTKQIKRNTKLLKQYDEELKTYLYDELGYKYTYSAFMVALRDNTKENKESLLNEFCYDFNINLIKDDIFSYRLKKAELRQSKTKNEILEKINNTNGFGDKEKFVLMQETDIRKLQYQDKYVESWLGLYKKYIHRYDI